MIKRAVYVIMIAALVLCNPFMTEKSEAAKYVNDRFRYSVEYPDSFTDAVYSTNGDGARLGIFDKEVMLTIYGSHNVLDMTLKGEFEKRMNSVDAAYHSLGESYYVVSWLENGIVYYEKKFISESYIKAFLFQYPASEKHIYDDLTAQIEGSFKR